MSILDYWSGKKVPRGQPYKWSAGMASNPSARGFKAVQRAAEKKRNQARHRSACRG